MVNSDVIACRVRVLVLSSIKKSASKYTDSETRSVLNQTAIMCVPSSFYTLGGAFGLPGKPSTLWLPLHQFWMPSSARSYAHHDLVVHAQKSGMHQKLCTPQFVVHAQKSGVHKKLPKLAG